MSRAKTFLYLTIGLVILFSNTVETRKQVKKITLNDVLETFDLLPKTETQRATINWDVNCSTAINQMIQDVTNIGNIFYLLLNGLYLGQWGDYESCLADANQGQYLLVNIAGDYNGTADFTRGGAGKYKNFSTYVGMCIPKQCQEKDVVSMNPHFTSMAMNVNWTNVSVSYTFASRDNSAKASSLTTGALITLLILAAMIVLGVVGSIVELSKAGDIADLNYEKLNAAAKFNTVKQYEPILLQRKKAWARGIMCFSPIRNFIKMSQMPPPYLKAMDGQLNQDLVKNLRVFNGIKALSSIYFIYGCTYFFSWYAIYDNPSDINKMKNNILFAIIPGVFFIVPMFLFTSGFLSTFSFLQTKETQQFSAKNIWNYYLRKVIKVIPFNTFCIAFFIFVMPYLGSGPIWGDYEKIVDPCKTYWWTNALFINNFYPVAYDDKCLGWNWYLPVYLQLTALLPFILLAYKLIKKKIIISIVFLIVMSFFFALNISLVATAKNGAVPILDDDNRNYKFYADIFMKPWFHINAYLLGVGLAMIYYEYVSEKSQTQPEEFEENSIPQRILNAINENAKIRYPLYLFGLFLMFISFLGCHGLLMTNDRYTAQGFYASFAYFTFALGFSMLIIPALLGKAQFVRFFFGGDLWSPFPNIAYGIYQVCPMICLFYFISMSNALHVDYQMFFYYFCGNFVFTLTLTNILYIFIDRPFSSMIRHLSDMEELKKNITEKNDISNFKKGVILGVDDVQRRHSKQNMMDLNNHSLSPKEEDNNAEDEAQLDGLLLDNGSNRNNQVQDKNLTSPKAKIIAKQESSFFNLSDGNIDPANLDVPTSNMKKRPILIQEEEEKHDSRE
ncbi:UNKNOWN [Stylonychia lemnae]|uniref:Acyltransferase 3 domain-containing protein n=1 Tax=Stylonychia lemnae TaxID=5949 RepID=A0A078B024_STYLE|nr:UNKNOWN [Stylonychia lemnae]|eukprot:CDW87686.1 UNKNOWN [Stylonychia lemnae]